MQKDWGFDDGGELYEIESNSGQVRIMEDRRSAYLMLDVAVYFGWLWTDSVPSYQVKCRKDLFDYGNEEGQSGGTCDRLERTLFPPRLQKLPVKVERVRLSLGLHIHIAAVHQRYFKRIRDRYFSSRLSSQQSSDDLGKGVNETSGGGTTGVGLPLHDEPFASVSLV